MSKKKIAVPLDEQFFRAYARLERLLNLKRHDLALHELECFERLHQKLFANYLAPEVTRRRELLLELRTGGKK